MGLQIPPGLCAKVPQGRAVRQGEKVARHDIALAQQKECEIIEGHVMPDHVHMLVRIPPKHAVSSVVGFLKGKSTIALLRQYCNKQRNFTEEHFWARGYAISTVGWNEDQIRTYIRNQEGPNGSAEGTF